MENVLKKIIIFPAQTELLTKVRKENVKSIHIKKKRINVNCLDTNWTTLNNCLPFCGRDYYFVLCCFVSWGQRRGKLGSWELGVVAREAGRKDRCDGDRCVGTPMYLEAWRWRWGVGGVVKGCMIFLPPCVFSSGAGGEWWIMAVRASPLRLIVYPVTVDVWIKD